MSPGSAGTVAAGIPETPPVLFIIFTQPDVTAEVFAAIRAAKPKRLYLAADGARGNRPGEAADCEATRQVVSKIDWDCECKTFFRSENAGCRKNVSEAISWFLDAVGEGIILEYDCLPHPDFFTYCATLLQRYREDRRVMSINGSNLQFGQRRGDGDYFFARLPNTWGWATWKRAWDLWEGDLKTLPRFMEQKAMESLFPDRETAGHLIGKFQDVFEGRNTSTWGFGWVYAHLAYNGASIYPESNLISNLGFTPKATHANDEKSAFSRIPLVGLASFRAPSFEIPVLSADQSIVRLAAYVPPWVRLKSAVRRAIFALLPGTLRRALKAFKTKSASP